MVLPLIIVLQAAASGWTPLTLDNPDSVHPDYVYRTGERGAYLHAAGGFDGDGVEDCAALAENGAGGDRASRLDGR